MRNTVGKLRNLRLSASLDFTTKTFDDFRGAAMKDSRRSLQQANLFSSRLGESRLQSGQLQEELTASRAQVKRLRGELMQSWKNSETVRRQNLIAVEQLEKQIQELTVKFQQLNKAN